MRHDGAMCKSKLVFFNAPYGPIFPILRIVIQPLHLIITWRLSSIQVAISSVQDTWEKERSLPKWSFPLYFLSSSASVLKSDCLAVLFPLWVCCRIVGHLCGLECWTQRHAELIVIVDTHTSAERIPTTIRRTDASSSKHKRLWRLGFLSQHIFFFFVFSFTHNVQLCFLFMAAWDRKATDWH